MREPRRPTIAHVLTSFHIGGAERVALELASIQVVRGHRVIAVSLEEPRRGPLESEFEGRGVAVYRVAKGPGVRPQLVIRLARLFRRLAVKVVHTHNPLPVVYAAPAARLARCAVVHSKHGVNPSTGGSLLSRLGGRFVHHFVAVSEATAAAALAQRACRPGSLEVIENGIDVSRFVRDPRARAAVRVELGIPEQAWVVGTVGRAAEPKNQALLLRAGEPLLGPEFHLIVVGDGPLLGALRNLAATFERAQSVHLLGARLDVPRLLSAFDVFALSSITEGLPLSVVEAMSAGLPVVATDVGGLADVVDQGETGFLVPSEDEGALRARLELLAGDRELAARLGQRAPAVAATRYSRERMADDYERLYRRALSGPPS